MLNNYIILILLFITSCNQANFKVDVVDNSSNKALKKMLSSNDDIEFESQILNLSNESQWQITFKTSIDINTLKEEDLKLINANLISIEEISSKEYVVLISPVDNGQVTFGLSQIGKEKYFGNSDIEISDFEATYDSVAPLVSVANTPLSIITSINLSLYSLTGSCETLGNDVLVTVGDKSFTVSCENALWIVSDLSTVTDGLNLSVTVTQSDNAGNIGTATTTINKDTIAPSITLDELSVVDASNKSSYSITGTCDDISASISIEIDNVAFGSPSSCDGTNFSMVIDLSNYNINLNLEVIISDSNGNTNSIQDELTLKEFMTIPQNLGGFNSLPSNTIFCVYEKNSILYLCTDGGLAISTDFGNTFTTKTTFHGLADNKIWDVVVDDLGKIYVATDFGLSMSTDGGTSFTTKSTADGLGNPSVRSLFLDTSGVIYAGCYSSGLSYSTDGGGTFTTLTTTSGIGGSTVNDVYVNSLGKVFIATSGGLSILQDGKTLTTGGVIFDNKTTIDGIGNNVVNSIAFHSNGNLYIATNGGVSYSSDGGISFTNIASGFASNIISDIYIDASDTIYASNSGLSVSSDGVNFSSLSSLSSNFVYKTFVGSNIYVATRDGLEISSDNGASFNVKQTTGLASNIVNDIFVDSNQKIYAATNNGLSISIDNGLSFINKNTVDGLGYSRIYSVTVDTNGIIYVGTYFGGFSFSTDAGVSFQTKTTTHGLGNNTVNKVFVDQNGKVYLATTGGLSILKDGSSLTDSGVIFDNLTAASNFLASDTVNDVFVDANGTIYAATGSGLSISTNGGVTFSSTPVASYLSVFVDYVSISDITIYAGKYGSLSISTDLGSTYTDYSVGSGLNKFSIFKDSSGIVYVSTNSGVAITDDDGVTSVNKDQSNGISGKNANAVYVNSSGVIYVATSAGISKSL